MISSGLPSRSTKVFSVIGSEFLEFTVRKYGLTPEEYLLLREDNFTEWIRIILHYLVSLMVKLVFCFTMAVLLTEYFHTFHREAREYTLYLHIIISCYKEHKMDTFSTLYAETINCFAVIVHLLLAEGYCWYPLQG